MSSLGALSPRLRALVDEAVARGFSANAQGNALTLYKGRGRATFGVVIYRTDTGAFYSAHRADTDLSVCAAIRTLRAVRRALDIP